MFGFNYYTPTEVVFGKGTESKTAAPIWLVETEDSMDSLYQEMESLVKELV